MTTTDIEHTRGTDFVMELAFVNDATSAAIDLTGSSVTMSVKRTLADNAYVAQATAALTDPTWWIATLSISDADLNVEDWNYPYTMLLTDAAWIVSLIAKWGLRITFNAKN